VPYAPAPDRGGAQGLAAPAARLHNACRDLATFRRPHPRAAIRTAGRREAKEETVEIVGAYTVPQAQLRTREAVCDPEIMKACIPACEAPERIASTESRLTMTTKIARRTARIKRGPAGKHTQGHDDASAKVGGKLAQVSARMVDAVARNLPPDFFSALSRQAGRERG
jgi:carbon monoxide dehydrogenase subunit G